MDGRDTLSRLTGLKLYTQLRDVTTDSKQWRRMVMTGARTRRLLTVQGDKVRDRKLIMNVRLKHENSSNFIRQLAPTTSRLNYRHNYFDVLTACCHAVHASLFSCGIKLQRIDLNDLKFSFSHSFWRFI